MKRNKGFTLIELMVVIAIIAIIAAIAIPNLMQSRIRANEATAVTVVKAYATAQVTFQVGKQGREARNTAAGDAGFCDNYRNLHYGVPVNQTAGVNQLTLISKTHADAYASTTNDNAATITIVPVGAGGAAGAVGPQSPYQGYYFMSPSDVGRVNAPAVAGGAAATTSWFATQFGQIAVPHDSSTTGTNAYYVGLQGQVYMFGLPGGKSLADNVGEVGTRAQCPANMTSDGANAAGALPAKWVTL